MATKYSTTALVAEEHGGVFDHSTLYLLCVIASCILYTINYVTQCWYINTFQ